MSNNHEFYLDHKKKTQAADGQVDRQGGGVCQEWGGGGTTGPRRRPSTLNKCFSFLSSLCCLYVCLPFLRCCFFFYFFFLLSLFILFFYYASALKDTNAGHGGDWRRPMPSRTPVVPFVCQPRLGRICGHVIAHWLGHDRMVQSERENSELTASHVTFSTTNTGRTLAPPSAPTPLFRNLCLVALLTSSVW